MCRESFPPMETAIMRSATPSQNYAPPESNLMREGTDPSPHISTSSGPGRPQDNCNELWWRDPGMRTLNFWLAVLFLSPFMIGFDGSLIGGLLAIPQWLKDLGLPNANQQGLMIAAQSLGGLIGSLPTSYLMDKIGRRRSLFWEISWSLVQVFTILHRLMTSDSNLP
ncbi:hypothetical protein HZ326_23185 [Fusarium oxysporum f. sp. albedinis]|nr:hypothetical protein HZ326_23185 [Fusarium oxysporum f. sp. albedinis]